MFESSDEKALAQCIRDYAHKLAEKALALDHTPGPDFNKNIHKLRVTLKRLGASWRLMRYTVSSETYEHAKVRLRDTRQLLSKARDQAVLGKIISRYSSSEDVGVPGKINTEIDWEKINTLIQAEITAWEKMEFRFRDTRPVNKGLHHTYRRVKKLGDEAQEKSARPEQRHEWRKWVKHLFYQLKILRHCGIKGYKKTIARLETLGEELGREHDLDVLQRFAKSSALPDSVSIIEQARREKSAIREQVRERYKSGFAKKARKLVEK
jgi:CHAD domain-containing protein